MQPVHSADEHRLQVQLWVDDLVPLTRLYPQAQTDAELQKVGFIRCGKMGCSPDSLRDKDGMVEIKTALPHLLIDMHMRGEFPPEHRAQCQGNLLVAQRAWIDIVVFWPKMPLFIARVHRDDVYIRAMEATIREFNAELAYVVSTMRKIA